MPIVAERTAYHLSKGDYIVPNRVRFYPYKVTYIDLHDYMTIPSGQKLPVFTDIIRAKNSDDAKNIIRAKSPRNIAFMTSGRHPERLGTSAMGVQVTTLTKTQLKAIENEVQSGSAKIPHRVDPKAFVSSNPNSTIYTRPLPSTPPRWPSQRTWASKADPIGAPRTAAKAAPMPLSTSVLDVGGFSVGFRKPGDAPAPPAPTVARPTPSPDIYGDIAAIRSQTVAGGSLVNSIADAGQSPVAMPSGLYKFTVDTNGGVQVTPSAAGTAPALEPKPLTKGPCQVNDRFDASTPPSNFKYMSVDSNKVDEQVSEVLKAKTAVQNEPSSVTPNTQPLFFDVEPDIPPTSCSCCPTESAPKRGAWFWVTLIFALAGIVGSGVWAWR